MGEAKRRKASDPSYGQPKPEAKPHYDTSFGQRFPDIPPEASAFPGNLLPESGRGLIVCSPMTIDGVRFSVRGGDIDPSELRFASLFWDRIVWPQNRLMHVVGGADSQYLEQAGVMVRPTFPTRGGEMGAVMSHLHWDVFQKAEQVDPGMWTISQGMEDVMPRAQGELANRAALVKLFGRIPLPDEDVPLAELLEFKQRREDELLALRSEIEGIYLLINGQTDQATAWGHALRRIDKASDDAVAAAKSAGFKFSMIDTAMTFALANVATIAALAQGDATKWPTIVGAQVAAAIRVGQSARSRAIAARTTPYRYVTSFHRDIF